MSKENINVDMDGVREPLTKEDGDGLAKVQFTASPDAVRFDGKPSNFIRSGLAKDELMKYANDPFWVRLRTLLFFLFWAVWFAMLIGAIIIIIVAPKCPASSKLKWYQRSSMCKLAPAHDSQTNVTAEKFIPLLKHLTEINVDTIILPPMQDEATFMSIDAKYGTMEDFDKFLAAASGLNIIMEFDFSKTTVKHQWFNLSSRSDPEYEEFYIWKNRTSLRQNADHYQITSNRPEEYLAPDWRYANLNIRSPKLLDVIKKVFTFWKGKGIKGFSLISIDTLINDGLANKSDITPIVKELRDYIYTKIDAKGKTALMVEVDNSSNLDAFIGTTKTNVADLAIAKFNTENQASSGKMFNNQLADHFNTIPNWNSPIKVGPWTGLTFDSSGNNQDYIEIAAMSIYMQANCTPIAIIGDKIGKKTVEHLSILNKYRREHMDSMLMGELHYPLVDEEIYSTVRVHPDNEGLLLVVNFKSYEAIKFNSTSYLPDEVELLINSASLNATGKFSLPDGLPVTKGSAWLFKYTTKQ